MATYLCDLAIIQEVVVSVPIKDIYCFIREDISVCIFCFVIEFSCIYRWQKWWLLDFYGIIILMYYICIHGFNVMLNDLELLIYMKFIGIQVMVLDKIMILSIMISCLKLWD